MLDKLSSLSGQIPPSLLHRFESLGPVAVTAAVSISAVALLAVVYRPFREMLVFSYNCFLQPLGKTNNQAERLDRDVGVRSLS